jgi:hypothetical protein
MEVMSKAKTLQDLVAAVHEADEPFVKKIIDPMKKNLVKDGSRVTTTGKNANIQNLKNKRRVQVTDTGKELRIKRFDNGKPGKEVKVRGTAQDLQKELNWAAKKGD